jgi:PAS domain S-box-containing protein
MVSPQTRTIRVAADRNYPPYSFIEQGKPNGFDIEILQAIAQAQGLELQIEMLSWNDARQKLESGEVDLIAGMSYSDERSKIYDFTIATTQISFDIFTRRGSPIHSIADLQDKTIIVQQGGLMQEWLAQQTFPHKLLLVQDMPQALEALSIGQGDCALLNKNQALYLTEKYGTVKVVPVGLSLSPQDYAIAVKKGNIELLTILNEGLNIIRNNGEYHRIHEKWFGIYERSSFWKSNWYLFASLGAVIILLAVFILWSYTLQKQVEKRTHDLAVSEERHRLIIENATEGILIIVNERIVLANPYAAQLLHQPIEDLPSKDLRELIHLKDREKLRRVWETCLQQPGTAQEYTLRLNYSIPIVLKFSSVGIRWMERPAILSLFYDITQEKRIEQDLQQQIAQLDILRAIDISITNGMPLKSTLQLLCEKLVETLKVDSADILVLNDEQNRLYYFAETGFQTPAPPELSIDLDHSYAGQAIKNRRMVIASSTDPDMPQLLGCPQRTKEKFVCCYVQPLIAKGKVNGVVQIFNRTPLNPNEEWFDFLATMAGQAAIAIDNHLLVTGLQNLNQELSQAYDATIQGWAHALELRSAEADDHTRRLLAMTLRLAKNLGVEPQKMIHIRRGVILHDIGKMAIPDRILLKPGPLSVEEWIIMRQHPQYAHSLLSSIPYLRPALEIPYSHHEHWDGSGYPLGLAKEDIPLSARIFSVVDVWDALTHDRVYRSGWPKKKAIEYIQERSGTQFDPKVVEAFIQMINED